MPLMGSSDGQHLGQLLDFTRTILLPRSSPIRLGGVPARELLRLALLVQRPGFEERRSAGAAAVRAQAQARPALLGQARQDAHSSLFIATDEVQRLKGAMPGH